MIILRILKVVFIQMPAVVLCIFIHPLSSELAEEIREKVGLDW